MQRVRIMPGSVQKGGQHLGQIQSDLGHESSIKATASSQEAHTATVAIGVSRPHTRKSLSEPSEHSGAAAIYLRQPQIAVVGVGAASLPSKSRFER
jgi:hypothetical protein